MTQQTLAMAADHDEGFEPYRKRTKRDAFLATMEQIVPWQALCSVIELNLADEASEEALLDSTALRRFVGIDLGRERVPDGTTLLKFRRLLERHKLGEALFAKVGEVLQARGLKGLSEFLCSRLRAGSGRSGRPLPHIARQVV